MEPNRPDGAGKAHAVGSRSTRAALDASLSRTSGDFHDFVADLEDLLQTRGAFTEEELIHTKARLHARVATARQSISDAEEAFSATSRSGIRRANDLVHDRAWTSIGIGAAVGVLIGLLAASLRSGRRRS
jgi:ElaB/YqjD/DUF883 family membrane-anchored ribosome-binding protein